MKIVVDQDIPYIKGVLEPFFEVKYLKGRDIKSCDIAYCDALFIRTRTRCTKELLEGSCVKFIGTATIGVDHIDLEYCSQNNIVVENAAGCNAMAVVQWVLSALVEFSHTQTITPSNFVVGVVGVGNVGSRVASVFKDMGFEVLECDPLRDIAEVDFASTPIDELLEKSDLVTIHTPLTSDCSFPTKYMINSQNIGLMKKGSYLFNAARGGVVEESALIDAVNSGDIKSIAIDVWENEPNINGELLEIAKIATPHIAGYSIQGKANGTSIIVRKIAERFSISELVSWYPKEVYVLKSGVEVSWVNIKRLTKLYYSISGDTKQLKSAPKSFEELRNSYNFRNQFM